MKFLRKHKGKIVALSTVILLLTVTYMWGGNIPDENVNINVADEKAALPENTVLEAPEEEISTEEEYTEGAKEENPPIEEKPDREEPLPQEPEPQYSFQQKMITDKENAADEYSTDPVPEGKPVPIEPQTVSISDKEYTCTLSVRCDAALKNTALLDSAKIPLLPSDGVILPPTEVTFYEGESVFNLLLREMKRNKIHMEYVNTPIYNSAYIEGINNLYEFDCGELSGWMYKVNGWFPNYGCSRYKLCQGDRVEWVYTCDLGRDIGENFSR